MAWYLPTIPMPIAGGCLDFKKRANAMMREKDITH